MEKRNVRCAGVALLALASTGILRLGLAQDSGLVGHWPLDEGTGTNTLDASGNERTGMLQGNPLPVWTGGVSSNALSFDGVQNAVVIPDDATLTPTNALSLSAWVKAQPLATGEIIAKWSTNGVGGSYMLSLTNGCVALELSLGGEYARLVGQTGIRLPVHTTGQR
jgi:hypothetical protein